MTNHRLQYCLVTIGGRSGGNFCWSRIFSCLWWSHRCLPRLQNSTRRQKGAHFYYQYKVPSSQKVFPLIKVCSKNVECVTTPGDTKWCSGPKTADCYSFNIVTDKWDKSGQMSEARAYASHVVMPDGRVWVMGGLGSGQPLSSTEIMKHNAETGQWKSEAGPDLPTTLFGHCTTYLPDGKVLRRFCKFQALQLASTYHGWE